MKTIISAHSTALFSTWYFLEDYGILFDAGDGVSSHLLQKSRKIKHVFISHPDRDHLAGLLQLLQLNARPGFPKIYYPKDSGSFPAMKTFLENFDRHVSQAEWHPIDDGSLVEIKPNIFVRAFRNEHVPAPPNVCKSLSFELFEEKDKLKKEFHGLAGKEIKALKETKGKDFLMEKLKKNILYYSADTPVDDYNKWEGANILIHEATFLYEIPEKAKTKQGVHNKHSTLAEVIEMVASVKPKELILGHFSSRHRAEDIKIALADLCKKHQVEIPIYLVLPGETQKNILAEKIL